MIWKSLVIASIAMAAACSSSDDTTTTSLSTSSTSASAATSASTSSGAGGGGTGGAGGAGGCDPASVKGIAIADTDAHGGQPYALGYPPYAIDGCTLVYVAPGPGDLVRRDLATGRETTIAKMDESPRRPTIAGEVIAWEATIAAKDVVRVSSGGMTTTVDGPFDHAGEPRATSDAVVFTGWLTSKDLGDTDVFLLAIGSTTPVAIAPGVAQQRWADVSADYVALTDFAEDPDGAFTDDEMDAADVVVVDRKTGTKHIRKMAGKQGFPLLGAGGRVAYLDWGLVHPEPKFSEYDLIVGDLLGDVATDTKMTHVQTSAPYVRPTARGMLVEWVEWQTGQSPVLWRQVADLSMPATEVYKPGAVELYGPASASTMTIVATRAGGKMTLDGIPRTP